jgi:hypothetical protein
MWRSAFIIALLLAGSPALAGQASTVIHVGIVITGNAAQAPAKPALKHSVPTRPRLRRPQ